MINRHNETLLHKAHVADMIRAGQRAHLARQLSSERKGISRHINAHRTVWMAASVILFVLLIFAGTTAASAQETLRQPSDGPNTQSGMGAFSYGFNAMHNGDYAGAITYFNDCINDRPDYASGYAFRGAAYYLLADYDTALLDFNVAIDLSPDYASAYNWRGLAYLAIGDYLQALADSRMAIQLDPTYTEAYRTQAIAYIARRQYVQAAVTLVQFLQQSEVEI